MRYSAGFIPLELTRSPDGSHLPTNAARAAAALHGLHARDAELRLVVLPEGVLSAGSDHLGPWPQPALLAPLAAAAAALGLHVAAADRFDGRTLGFVIGPDGEPVLVQPAIDGSTGAATVEVLRTPLGTLACLPGDDPMFAEYVRLALFAGAEIVLNPCSERLDAQHAARQLSRGARCWESTLILVAASAAGAVDSAGRTDPGFAGAGLGGAWSPQGALVGPVETVAGTARIDLAELRARRVDPWVNFPAQLRTSLYAPFYARAAAALPRPVTEAAPSGPVYDVLLMQAHQVFVQDPTRRDAVVQDNLRRALALARPFAARPQTRLVVLPEFFLQGSPFGSSPEFWEQVGIRLPGPETEALGNFCRETNVFLSGAVLEYDPDWPARFFNTAFIIGPDGRLLLRYRKLQCADLNGLMNVTTPGNVYSDYVARYGEESLIPVVETEIGTLGCAVCFDSNWPELWRILALKGVEVVCNPTSEIHSDRRPAWYAAKRAHAAENFYYVASANAGSEQFAEGVPTTAMNRGHSALIDFHGNLASCADGGGVVPLAGRVDLGALRRARASAGENLLARFAPGAVAAAYAQFPGFPLDCFRQTPMTSGAQGIALVREQVARLQAAGVLAAP
jgi:predicted amidohydrolase